MKIVVIEIVFHNMAELRVQMQLYDGRSLVGTCVVGPGESGSLPIELERYDIYLKNSVTGWEVGHQLNSVARTLTLSQQNGRYLIT
jgi:hypothetical protein